MSYLRRTLYPMGLALTLTTGMACPYPLRGNVPCVFEDPNKHREML